MISYGDIDFLLSSTRACDKKVLICDKEVYIKNINCIVIIDKFKY